MHLSVDRSDFFSALQVVSRAVSSRTPLPVLSGVLLEAAGQNLVLTATDLEITIRTKIPAQVSREGSVVLSSRYLLEYVRRIPEGSIEVSLGTDGQAATLRWQRSEHQVNGFSPDQFPDLPAADNGRQLLFPQSLFRQIIQQTAFAVSNDETRPVLTGVHIRLSEEGIDALATDGFRVAMKNASSNFSGDAISMILPGRALQEIMRILNGDSNEPAALSFSGNQVHIDVGHAQISSRLIDGQYPNVKELLPSHYPIRAQVDRISLLQAVDRAALMSDSRLTARLVILDVTPHQLVITSRDPEAGEAHEELPIELEGEGLQIGLNARYLLDGLQHVSGDEVWLEFIDPVKAVRLRGCNDESFQYIAFPVRL